MVCFETKQFNERASESVVKTGTKSESGKTLVCTANAKYLRKVELLSSNMSKGT